MPVYNVSVEGKDYKIELIRTNRGTFLVRIGNKSMEVKFDMEDKRGETFTLLMDGRSYKVEVKGLAKVGSFPVKVNNTKFKVEVKPPEMRALASASISRPVVAPVPERKEVKTIEEGAVTAPMTGKIVDVRVKEGEEVKEGQVLCVLESMKMESEITTPWSGRVKRIKVFKGMSVNEGDPLVIIS